MTIVQKLFSFQGRLSRLDWWVFGVALNIVGAVLTGMLSASLIKPGTEVWGSATAPAQLVGLFVTALLVWPSLALTVKRRHDRDRPGWLAAALFLLLLGLNSCPLFYVVLGVVAFEHYGWGGLGLFLLALAVLWLGLVILLGFLPGTKGPNRYGPSPLDHAPPEDSQVP